MGLPLKRFRPTKQPGTCALASEAGAKLISIFGGAVIPSLPAIFVRHIIAGNSIWPAGIARFCASSKQKNANDAPRETRRGQRWIGPNDGIGGRWQATSGA